MVLAADKKQARAIFRYLKGMLQIPLLAGRIERETAEAIDLNNNITVEILAADFKKVRSYTLCAALCDEEAFWTTDEGGANPDTEIIGAIKPAMATTVAAISRVPCSSPGVEIRHTKLGGRMLALLKGYPNTTIIIFYVLASAISVLAMYRYHRSQM
jgi:hypothetical protein